MHYLFRDVHAPHNGHRSTLQCELLLKVSFIFHDMFFSVEKLHVGVRARKHFINILLYKQILHFFFNKNIIYNCSIHSTNLVKSEHTQITVSNREIFQIKSWRSAISNSRLFREVLLLYVHGFEDFSIISNL